MKISAFKIHIAFIILTVLGLFIIPRLSVKLNPTSTLPSITVSYSWNNAAPYVLEREITSKLEGGLSLIKGVSKLTSRSLKGSGTITLSFDKYTDQDLITALNKALGDVNFRGNFITLSIQAQKGPVNWHIPIKKVGDRIVYLDDVASS